MQSQDFEEEKKLPEPVYCVSASDTSPKKKERWVEGEKLPSLPTCCICFAEMGEEFFPV